MKHKQNMSIIDEMIKSGSNIKDVSRKYGYALSTVKKWQGLYNKEQRSKSRFVEVAVNDVASKDLGELQEIELKFTDCSINVRGKFDIAVISKLVSLYV